jgi:hypothetical protein
MITTSNSLFEGAGCPIKGTTSYQELEKEKRQAEAAGSGATLEKQILRDVAAGNF